MKKTSNKNSANGYCPLDQNKLIPNSNIPQLSFSNLTNIFNIVSPANNQILYYNGSQWINQNISESNVLNLTSDLLSCEKNK